jgi:polygalacturonase
MNSTFNIIDYGAISDNSTINTLAIQSTIDAAASSGGGLVYFPPGAFKTGGLNMSSNVYLYLASGAFIQASNNVSDYPYGWDFWDIIHGENITNTGILGESTSNSILSGPMWQMISSYSVGENQLEPITWSGIRGCMGECRPRGVVFVDSTNITLSNFWLRDSADWSSLYRRCKNIVIDSMVISGSTQWANNDIADFESVENVLVSNLVSSGGDDGLVFVSGHTNGLRFPDNTSLPTRNIRVYNASFVSYSSALKFESVFAPYHGDVHDIVVKNVSITGSNRGIAFQQRAGNGSFYDILLEDISVQTKFVTGTTWWGSGEAISFTSVAAEADPACLNGTITNVTLRNIIAISENSAIISARDRAKFSINGILLENVSLTLMKYGNVSRPLHDYRPVDTGPVPNVETSLVQGFYLNNADVTFRNCSVVFAGTVQPYWDNGRCIYNDNNTARVQAEEFNCLPSSDY